MNRYCRFKAVVRQRIGIGPVGCGALTIAGYIALWFVFGVFIQIARAVLS